MEEFKAFIKKVVSIDEHDLDLVISKCRLKTVPKGKLILKKGQIANQYFFIVSGGVRFYYHIDHQENTTWVCFKNEFFTEISSLNPQKPTRFNIQAIEKTEVIVIDGVNRSSHIESSVGGIFYLYVVIACRQIAENIAGLKCAAI